MKVRRAVEWLRTAYKGAPGCPSPEAFLPSSMEAMSAADRRRIEDHATRCPACSAELDLAREFEATSDDIASLGEDVDFVVSRIGTVGARDARAASVPETGRKTGRTTRRIVRYRVLAAAAVLAMAILGWIGTWDSSPPLPPRQRDHVVRGSRVELLFPVGELRSPPDRLRWAEIPGAASYVVHILRVDGSVVYETLSGAPGIELPAGIRSRLLPLVVYSWQVEALDSNDSRIAVSETGEFRIGAAAEDHDRFR